MTINHDVVASSSPSTLHCVAGSISAGCFSTLIGHPLDTIKVHQQTNFSRQRIPRPPPRNTIVMTSSNSTTSALEVAKILTRGGGDNYNVFRLFKGIGPPMANQIIMNTIMFSTFYKIKENTSSSDPLLAGLLSGFVTACISTPTDWIKIQAQLSLTDVSKQQLKQQQQQQQQHRKKNITDVVSILKRIMYNKDGKLQVLRGVRTLYRGHVANLGREGVFTMVYLGLYDKIISNVVTWGKNNNADDGDDDARNNKNVVCMGTVILISSFTGACAWICNYPFDTIKSVMQASAGRRGEGPTPTITTMRSAILSIYKSGGGVNAFFRGVGSSTFRAMLVTSSRMVAYEKTIQLIS